MKVKITFQKNNNQLLSDILITSYYQTYLNKICCKNDDAATEIVAVMRRRPHYIALDNCLLYMDVPHKSAILCGSTALISVM